MVRYIVLTTYPQTFRFGFLVYEQKWKFSIAKEFKLLPCPIDIHLRWLSFTGSLLTERTSLTNARKYLLHTFDTRLMENVNLKRKDANFVIFLRKCSKISDPCEIITLQNSTPSCISHPSSSSPEINTGKKCGAALVVRIPIIVNARLRISRWF